MKSHLKRTSEDPAGEGAEDDVGDDLTDPVVHKRRVEDQPCDLAGRA